MNLKKLSRYIFFGLLAYMPLHIFLSTWIGSSFNILNFMKVAKDIVLVVGFILAVVSSSKSGIKKVLKHPVFLIIGVYTALTVSVALLKPTDIDAEILAIVYNTRFLLFFLYGWLLTYSYDAKQLIIDSSKIVMAVAIPVMLFGVIQYAILPSMALEHVGYSKENGVLAFFAIDSKPDLERIMSTVRDPNTYGSYLIIIGSLAMSIFLNTKKKSIKNILAGVMGLVLINTFLTFSRSAWIGLVLAALSIFIFSHHKDKLVSFVKKYALLIGAILIIILLGLWVVRDTYLLKNVVFHADEKTTLEDPNELRVRFFKESVAAIIDQPLGHGPGTAGIVSLRNDIQGKTLNENYYLQVAYEVGVLGLLLFLLILIYIFRHLLGMNNNTYAIALLASFIGLAFTNLLVHVWSNEAVAYTAWGLAGIIFSFSGKTKQAIKSKQ